MSIVGELPARVEVGIPLIAGAPRRADDGALVVPIEWRADDDHHPIPIRVGVGDYEPRAVAWIDPCEVDGDPMAVFAAALRAVADAIAGADG